MKTCALAIVAADGKISSLFATVGSLLSRIYLAPLTGEM
jgi:hypothetical protein